MEITSALHLSKEEASLLDMHSVLNVLNVINFELIQIGELFKEDEEVFKLVEEVARAGKLLRKPEEAQHLVSDIDGFIASLEETLDVASSHQPPEVLQKATHFRENLQTIYEIIRIRAREILVRHENPNQWVEHSVSELQGNFVDFLAAIEKNANGRYAIVQNIAEKGSGDYLINFDISSEQGGTLTMPIILQEVMRDLLANARKYTKPGGNIQGGLHAGREGLSFFVKDDGVGIPEEDLEEVVLFGKRADNIMSIQTRGGGFGLTKAYDVTTRYGGRMWIESSTGKGDVPSGTSVTITIPYPVKN